LVSADDSPSFTERFRMKSSFNPTCDRHGHMLTGVGGSPQVMAPFVFPTAEEIALFSGGAGNGSASTGHGRSNGSKSNKRKVAFRIRKILVPVDSERTKPADLKRTIQLARQLDAQIMLLHCYESPRSFTYAKGDSGFDDVIRHRERNLVRLQSLCSKVRRSWSKCGWIFEDGPLPASILGVSKSMRADLIVVPASLDAASENWSTSEVVDELARKAHCPVLAGKATAGGKVT
jgi:nucleotide-binding universal stress UspA family protein